MINRVVKAASLLAGLPVIFTLLRSLAGTVERDWTLYQAMTYVAGNTLVAAVLWFSGFFLLLWCFRRYLFPNGKKA